MPAAGTNVKMKWMSVTMMVENDIRPAKYSTRTFGARGSIRAGTGATMWVFEGVAEGFDDISRSETTTTAEFFKPSREMNAGSKRDGRLSSMCFFKLSNEDGLVRFSGVIAANARVVPSEFKRESAIQGAH